MTAIYKHPAATDLANPSFCDFRSDDMLSSRDAQANTELFVSAKTATAIPTPCPMLRDALIQASLDPLVRSIEFVASARVGSETVRLDALVLVRHDGRHLLEVVPARAVRDVEEEGLALIALDELGLPTITLTAAEVQREPRLANSRLVWNYRLHPVGIGLRMRILTILTDEGPMSLSRLLPQIRSDRDPSPAIMAMACANLIELDLVSGPLGPATIARCAA
jgi:hypothetical protein